MNVPGQIAELGATMKAEAEIVPAGDEFAPERDLVLVGDGAEGDGAQVGTRAGDAGLALGGGGEDDGAGGRVATGQW